MIEERPRVDVSAEDRVDEAIELACATASGVAVGGAAVVGFIGSTKPQRVRSRPTLDADALESLFARIAGSRDGQMTVPADGRDGPWHGSRFALDGGRVAFAVVRTASIDDGTALRLSAIALDLARTGLIVEGQRRNEQLDRLLTTARRVAESLDLETVLASIIEDATALLGADSGDMLLWDRERDTLRVVAVADMPRDMIGFELRFGEGLSSEAILAQHPIEVAEYGDYENRAAGLERYDFGAVLCAPLVFRGDAIGTINVHARRTGAPFLPGAADLLAAFAGHAATAIEHARRYENEVRLGRVLAETNRELSRSLTVQQRLAEQVILDAGPAGIAIVLAEHLGRRVVIQDHLHRLIAGAAPDGGDAWRRLVGGGNGSADAQTSEREPFTIAVRVGRDVVGHLLLSSDADLGPIDRALVDVATTGVALEFAKERAAAEVEENLRGEAAADLLTGSYTTEESIAARAARLGYDLGEPMNVIVIEVTPDSAEAATNDHDRLRRGVQLVRERLGSRPPRSLATAHSGVIVILYPAARKADRDGRGGREVADLAADIKTVLESGLESGAAGGAVTVAISETCHRPNDYAPAFSLAREAIELMVRLGRRGTIVAAGDLGTYGLLLRASSREELDAFAQRTLRPVIEHDRAHGGDLLTTLRAYIAEDRVQRRVAARCFIHVNTVVYRIRRIEALLDVHLDDPATVFDVTLALRLLDLLDDTPPPPDHSTPSPIPHRAEAS